MPSEHRNVEVAPGHVMNLRRATNVPPRDGKVLLVHRRRDPIEVDQARWDAAEVTRG